MLASWLGPRAILVVRQGGVVKQTDVGALGLAFHHQMHKTVELEKKLRHRLLPTLLHFTEKDAEVQSGIKGQTHSKLVAESRSEPTSPASGNNAPSPTLGGVTLGNSIIHMPGTV